MNKTRILKRSLLAAAVIASTSQAHAAGFQLNAQSATGIGRAFAGDAVIADNASSMARNPATMALFDKTSLSLGFEAIITDISVSDVTVGGALPYPDYDDIGGTSLAPNIHLIVPVNDKFAWGINAYSNFGTSTDFSGSPVYTNSAFGGETDILSMNIGLAGSYRLNEQWSFGAGLDIIYGKGTIRRGNQEIVPTLPAPVQPAFQGKQLIDIEDADGWGVGFNLGTVYELNENNRFGLSYRYSPEITAKDDNGQEITLPLPDMAEFSGYHHINETAFAVHYSVQWIGWSAFDKIDFENLNQGCVPNPAGIPTGDFCSSSYSKDYKWQDGWHFAIGGTWYLNDKVTLRTGYMHDTAAQDELTSISVPDSDRNWISGGATYHFSENANVDFGITYLIGSDETATEGGALVATTRADAILVGLQYSQQF
ncbi:outer membrane protein transport protein [Vibrio breoganii]|uniref:outer membrane protein transport protein n=1 Tax=Vibrio breoganii TaxID=553239 RepID=UPI00080DAE5C|nr:outer membrane protein transport protein [Vibrio breoganii]OCH73605.1 long-chain fatty acid transporter [Vibrio breoganii]PMK19221.1 long-chain fatty acid transporter [Vibrio breoganii]PML54538.1 long-chain fatty acid transporter [Vibrio breoganii]PMM83177.1 long-chain fatty acid transporter [Vibrio breoganii]